MTIEPVLVEVTRGESVESAHRGSFVVLGPSGREILCAGDPRRWIFPRSALKPLQAVAMVRSGLSLPPRLLALACASHSGEQFHLDAVREILSSVGLGEPALQNSPGFPYDEGVRHAWLRAGGVECPLVHNCSGKHAAMLATCVHNDWSTTGYCELRHPLSANILATCAELTGATLGAVGIDGCGAPAPQTSLLGLARAYRSITCAPHGSAQHDVASAIRSHPEMVGGTHREVTALMHASPGLIAKDGAEGVMAIATADGFTIALKLTDGASRGRIGVGVALLRWLGVVVDPSAAFEEPVIAGTRTVGSVRPSEWLRALLHENRVN